MKHKKGSRTKTVFLFVFFIGTILVCFENTSVQAGPPAERQDQEGNLPLIREGGMIVSQAEKEPSPPPSWMGPKTPGTLETPEKTAPEFINPKSPGAPPPSIPIQVVPPPRRPPAAPAPPAAPVPGPAPSPAPVAPPAPAPPPPIVTQKGSGFIFNFDNADLYEVIRVMAEVMKLSYLIDPRVKGVVNIHTTGQISTDDVFPIFQTILQLNGATAVKKGQLYEIVPFGDAKKLPFSSKIDDGAKLPAEERYAIQIIVLKYIPVSEASKMIKPFLSDGADIIEHPPLNILIVGDMASNIRKVLDLINLFDIDLFTDLRVRIYPVTHSDVNEIAKEMERLFASFEVSTKSGRGVGITFTPISRINALLVVSSIPNIFDKVEGWLKQLDRTPTDEAKLGVFVYYVQNGKAKDMADVVKQIFTPPKERRTTTSTTTPGTPTTPATPQPRSARPTPAPAPPATPPATPGEEGIPTGEINIVVDETTNALIIRAYPREYKFVLETIKKLDLYPKQVLIEVYLASVTLDENNQYGLEFSKFTDSFTKGGKLYTWSLGLGGTGTPADFTSGIRYAIEATDKLTAAVHASAVDNRLKVISSPHLLASNNKEAKIQIGTSQPILTNTYTTGITNPTTGTSVVEGTIEYKDVGIILTVTPRISDGGLVTMDLSLEDSTVNTTKLGSLDNVPVFSKKTAKTTLSIMEGQTIVIGGMIEDSKTVNKSGVPFLSKIPLLGGLFGYHNYDKAKTEFLLLLTPHIITDIDQSNAVTRDFREKVETIRKDMEKSQKGEKPEKPGKKK